MDDQGREEGGHIGDLFGDEEAVDEFFTPRARRRSTSEPARKKPKKKPTHYKVISISLYTEDLERLKGLVRELKARGHSRANRSLVIREALRQIDLDVVPPQR